MNKDETTKLLNEYLDNELDHQSQKEIGRMLNSSEDFRREFREAVRLEALMRDIALEQAASETEEFGLSKVEYKKQTSRVLFLAASIFLTLGSLFYFLMQEKKPVDNEMALEWIESTAIVSSEAPLLIPSINQIDDQRGGTSGGAIGGSPGGKQVPRGGLSQIKEDLQHFIDQFEFDFSIPENLEVGWEFNQGYPLSENRVHLIYLRDQNILNVYLWSDSGHDKLPFSYTGKDGKRQIIVLRMQGLGIAFEGGQAEAHIWEETAGQFLAE